MRRAILTGYRRGLGAALLQALHAADFTVMGIGRGDALPAVANGETVSLDLADTVAVLRWLESDALSIFLADASQAVLINNAGVLAPMGRAGELSSPAIADAVAVNVTAPLLSDTFLHHTRGMTDRRIVHVSSGAARMAYAGWSVYGSTKAALDQHARTVAAEKLPGCRIESMAPGIIDTDMQAMIRETGEADFPMREKFVDLHRQGALAPPADVAERLVRRLLDASFGDPPVTDLRAL